MIFYAERNHISIWCSAPLFKGLSVYSKSIIPEQISDFFYDQIHLNSISLPLFESDISRKFGEFFR